MIKNLIIAVALLLTIGAGKAEAQVGAGAVCPEGSTLGLIQLPMDCDGISSNGAECTIFAYYCWVCPSDNAVTSFSINIYDINLNGCSCSYIEALAAAEAYLTDWDFIERELCPSWADVKPCTPPNTETKKVKIQYPLCFQYYKDAQGELSMEPCTPITCLCSGEYVYCYENGVIRTTFNGKSIVAVDGYSGPCPPVGDCSTYNKSTVPIPQTNSTYSPCFNICE